MADRPIFVPAPNDDEIVRELYVSMRWHAGFSASQKRQNVVELHRAAALAGYSPVLEVSTKSAAKLGRHLSAFHLKVRRQAGAIPLESAFQGSKVFEHGGPFVDLYSAEPKLAKRDPRLRTSGRLVAFDFEGVRFPLEPMTAFYDWLYIGSIYPHREWLTRLYRYAAFSDIEFNPERSINCQARSCALFVALMSKGLLDDVVKSPEAFLSTIGRHAYGAGHTERASPQLLFSEHPFRKPTRKARTQASKRTGSTGTSPRRGTRPSSD